MRLRDVSSWAASFVYKKPEYLAESVLIPVYKEKTIRKTKKSMITNGTTASQLRDPAAMLENSVEKALGILATIPAKIRSEIPLPTPYWVILSPSHTRNIDPAVTDTIAIRVNGTLEMMMASGMVVAYTDTANDWIRHTTIVP